MQSNSICFLPADLESAGINLYVGTQFILRIALVEPISIVTQPVLILKEDSFEVTLTEHIDDMYASQMRPVCLFESGQTHGNLIKPNK
jgi:hypothetical protein